MVTTQMNIKNLCHTTYGYYLIECNKFRVTLPVVTIQMNVTNPMSNYEWLPPNECNRFYVTLPMVTTQTHPEKFSTLSL